MFGVHDFLSRTVIRKDGEEKELNGKRQMLRCYGALVQQLRPVTATVSMRQPARLPVLLPLSVAQRQRNWIVWPSAAAGRLTMVVIYPPEFPLHENRPARAVP